MSETPQRQAWLEGHRAGVLFMKAMNLGETWNQATSEAHPASRTPELFAAWASGFGHGISDEAGCIPGHHLSGTVRGIELVSDR